MDFMYMLSAALIPAEVTNWLRPTLQILMALVSVAAIVIILMQKGTNNNIGVIGGQETDTYAGKNKAKSKESILRKLTIVMGVLFLVISVLFFITYLEA
ncbi:MAG: preprotein translocase subunit SecG [Christensenellales bacterium]